MTVEAFMSEHAKVKGNLEYSIMTVRRYLFLDTDGKGPLKSTLLVSQTAVLP